MRRHLIGLAAAVPLLLAAACGEGGDGSGGAAGATGGAAEGAGLEQLVVGAPPTVDVAPLHLGVEQGFFEQQGIELTVESAQGGAEIVPAVVRDEVQFGFSDVTSLLVAADTGIDLDVVANGAASTGEQGADYSGVVARAEVGIADAAGLAGRRVAVNLRNDIGTTTVNESIRRAGADPREVEYVELPFPDMPAALARGEVDAVSVVEPFLTAATTAGGSLLASNYVDAADDLTVALYFTSGPYAAQNPEVVEGFAAAIEESLIYAQANPDEVRRVLPGYAPIEQAVADSLQLPAWPIEVNRASVERLAQLAVGDGLLREVPDLDALLP